MRRTGWHATMLIVPMLAVVLAAGPTLVRAQEASPALGPGGVLVRVAVPSLPGPPDPGVEVWLYRLVLDPGVALPPSPDLGVNLLHVEQGELTFVVEGTVEVVRASGTPEALPPTGGAPAEVTLGPGDSLLTGTGTRTGVRNAGDQPAVVLNFLVFSPIEEEAAMEAEAEVTPIDQMTGVRPQLLSVGRGSLPAGPGTLVIERLTVAPGERPEADRANGVEVGAVERGTIRLQLIAGDAWVWPSAMSPTPGAAMTGPETIPVGAERVLHAGDGYALSTGATGSWHDEGNEPVTILRAVVEPLAEAAGTPTPKPWPASRAAKSGLNGYQVDVRSAGRRPRRSMTHQRLDA